MMKEFLLAILTCLWFHVGAQWAFDYDTLTHEHRIHGVLDSVDYKSGFLPASVDGGIPILDHQGLSSDRLAANFVGFAHQEYGTYARMKFSGLPYIGFSYSFGSRGAQFISARYAQVFKNALILNVDFDRNLSSGYLRNTGFRRNSIKAQLARKGNRYSFHFMGSYLNDSLFHAGGVVWDSTTADNINNLGLAFISVQKSNAASNAQRGHVGWNNFINISGDSLNQWGGVTKHSFRIKNRRFMESGDSLNLSYAEVNIDTLQTRDQFNLSSISNAAGIFRSSNGMYFDALIEHTYWKFLNLSNSLDSTEVDLKSNFTWNWRGIGIRNVFKFNLLGSFNALQNHTQLHTTIKQIEFNGHVNIERIPPVPMKRFYFANNFSYLLSDIRLQNRWQIGGDLGSSFWKNQWKLKAFVNYLGFSDVYLFKNTTWESSGSLNVLEIGMNSSIKYGKFHIDTRLISALNSKSYLPNFQGYARVYVKSKVFKAKKMEVVLGLDGSMISSFNHRTYIPALDIYDWTVVSERTGAMANAHFFFAFNIASFRFFARFENIGYFWNDRSSFEQSGYPIAGTRIRLGITWDFLN